MVGSQLRNFGQVSATALDSTQRARQQTVAVASRHTDPRRSDIDGKPDTRSQCAVLQPHDLRIDTVWLQHGFTLRYPWLGCRQ
jgi:hypothetical protein